MRGDEGGFSGKERHQPRDNDRPIGVLAGREPFWLVDRNTEVEGLKAGVWIQQPPGTNDFTSQGSPPLRDHFMHELLHDRRNVALKVAASDHHQELHPNGRLARQHQCMSAQSQGRVRGHAFEGAVSELDHLRVHWVAFGILGPSLGDGAQIAFKVLDKVSHEPTLPTGLVLDPSRVAGIAGRQLCFQPGEGFLYAPLPSRCPGPSERH